MLSRAAPIGSRYLTRRLGGLFARKRDRDSSAVAFRKPLGEIRFPIPHAPELGLVRK